MRLFVAVRPPADVVDQVLDAVSAAAAADHGRPLRWARAEHLHLTLTFLGEVGDEIRSRVEQRLARVAGRYAPLTLQLAGAGRFGQRVLFVKVAGDRDRLGRLAASTTAAARRSDVAVEERVFRAHLTIARAGPGADLRPLVAALNGYRSEPWTVADVHLLRSRLGAAPEGRPAYDTIASWPLTGRHGAGGPAG